MQEMQEFHVVEPKNASERGGVEICVDRAARGTKVGGVFKNHQL